MALKIPNKTPLHKDIKIRMIIEAQQQQVQIDVILVTGSALSLNLSLRLLKKFPAPPDINPPPPPWADEKLSLFAAPTSRTNGFASFSSETKSKGGKKEGKKINNLVHT